MVPGNGLGLQRCRFFYHTRDYERAMYPRLYFAVACDPLQVLSQPDPRCRANRRSRFFGDVGSWTSYRYRSRHSVFMHSVFTIYGFLRRSIRPFDSKSISYIRKIVDSHSEDA
jgi:hypothetical protein